QRRRRRRRARARAESGEAHFPVRCGRARGRRSSRLRARQRSAESAPRSRRDLGDHAGHAPEARSLSSRARGRRGIGASRRRTASAQLDRRALYRSRRRHADQTGLRGNMVAKSYLTELDFSAEETKAVLDRAKTMKKDRKSGGAALAGKHVALYFD